MKKYHIKTPRIYDLLANVVRMGKKFLVRKEIEYAVKGPSVVT